MSLIDLTAPIQSIDVTSNKLGHHSIQTAVPLIQISSHEHDQSVQLTKPKQLPLLPSHKFCHTIWHELRSTEVKGDELRAPRVREGPESKVDSFYSLSDDNGNRIHHDRTGQELKDYTKAQENWENARHVNLSFQKLDHSYQHKHFHNILSRLRAVEVLIVKDNSLHDLSDLSFTCCKKADFSTNYFNSFNSLPKMPVVESLTLYDNQISSVKGLSRFPKLKTLNVRGNGLYFDKYYRNRVFKVLPNLIVLDDTLQLPADRMDIPVNENESGRCAVM